MDRRVRAYKDGTLYLDARPTPPAAPHTSHGLLYYAALLVVTVFVLFSLAVTAFFVFFLVLAFL